MTEALSLKTSRQVLDLLPRKRGGKKQNAVVLLGEHPKLLSVTSDTLEAIERLAVSLTSAQIGVVERLVGILVEDTTRSQRLIETMLPSEVATPAEVLQLRRNALARQQVLEEFGAYSSAELADLRGSRSVNPSTTSGRWLAARKIFAVSVAGDRRFPAFQFDEQGQPLPIIKTILDVFGDRVRGWEIALWLTGANGYLDGRRPVDVLGSDAEAVVEAARNEIDQPEF